MALNGLVAANNLSDVVNSEEAWDNIGNSLSATIPIPSPTLDLDFANNRSLIDNVSGNNLITFDRASTGTFVGSDGLIQTAASGVPRFSYTPMTNESLGLLVEDATTNLLPRSEQFDDNVSWEKVDSLVTANAIAAPDGSITADKFIEAIPTNPSGHYLYQFFTYAPNTPYTFSVFIKAGERFKGYITLDTSLTVFPGGPANGAVFDLSAKTLTLIVGSIGASMIEFPGGWFRLSLTATSSAGGLSAPTIRLLNNTGTLDYAGDGISGLYVWGAQLETQVGATSYIPTTTATVTRAADIANISGSNFNSWYNQEEGTMFADVITSSAPNIYRVIWDVGFAPGVVPGTSIQALWSTPAWYLYPPIPPVNVNSLVITGSGATAASGKIVAGMKANNSIIAANGLLGTIDTSCAMPSPATVLYIGRYIQYSGQGISGTIKRLTYYPARLPNVTLQGLSLYGAVSSFSYSFSIKGRDILALKEVNKVSTRDFVLAKGLSSSIQPRITTASQYTSSGVVLRNAAMPKIAPITRGNYFFSAGLTLSGVSCQINGTNARSIATSPFSGSGATVPLLFAGLRPQANWRISEAMTSGTVTAPESAIPIETSDFLLFIKAGQS